MSPMTPARTPDSSASSFRAFRRDRGRVCSFARRSRFYAMTYRDARYPSRVESVGTRRTAGRGGVDWCNMRWIIALIIVGLIIIWAVNERGKRSGKEE